MKCEKFFVGMALALVTCAAIAQGRDAWKPANTTAESITGEVRFGDEIIMIDLASFPAAQIRPLTPGEASALFAAETGAAGYGSLYRVSIPAAKRFLHKNTLCGDDQVQWMASYVSRHKLELAFFSGDKMPVLSSEALNNTTSLCGTFAYVQ